MSSQPQLIKGCMAKSDKVYTPDWVARDMVLFFKPTGRILEPARGLGAIYDHLPLGSNWCEIDEGRDFLADIGPLGRFDWIITNPPYSLLIEFLEHSFDMADNIVFLIPIAKFFSGKKYMQVGHERGWLKHVRIYGSGSLLGFSHGNPFGALYWKRGYHGDTSWSWFEEGI